MEPISAIAPIVEPELTITSPAQNSSVVQGSDFGQWFAAQLANVNTSLLTADNNVQKMSLGQTANLHEMMIQMEEAKLSLQLLAQVRNRLLDAYQEVMRMQV